MITKAGGGDAIEGFGGHQIFMLLRSEEERNRVTKSGPSIGSCASLDF